MFLSRAGGLKHGFFFNPEKCSKGYIEIFFHKTKPERRQLILLQYEFQCLAILYKYFERILIFNTIIL